MTETPRIYDLAAEYIRVARRQCTGVSVHTIRGQIAAGRLVPKRIGKKFYVTKVALDAWIERTERRK